MRTFTPITNAVQALGLTRDSALWFWGRLTAGALLVASGLIPLDQYLTPTHVKWVQAAAVVVLWLSGRYDSSPLPGARKP